MIHAYDELYLDNAMKVLAVMLDYAVYDLDMDADDYMQQFIMSGIATQFGAGNPKYVAGMSGIELASEVYWRIRGRYPTEEYSADGSRRDFWWAGFALGFYQWDCGDTFSRILGTVPTVEIVKMYDKYHEMDLRQFADEMNRRRRLSAYAEKLGLQQMRKRKGYSQSKLAKISGVSVRSIQQYEQGQKNLNRAAAETVVALAKALSCPPEQLII